MAGEAKKYSAFGEPVLGEAPLTPAEAKEQQERLLKAAPKKDREQAFQAAAEIQESVTVPHREEDPLGAGVKDLISKTQATPDNPAYARSGQEVGPPAEMVGPMVGPPAALAGPVMSAPVGVPQVGRPDDIARFGDMPSYEMAAFDDLYKSIYDSGRSYRRKADGRIAQTEDYNLKPVAQVLDDWYGGNLASTVREPIDHDERALKLAQVGRMIAERRSKFGEDEKSDRFKTLGHAIEVSKVRQKADADAAKQAADDKNKGIDQSIEMYKAKTERKKGESDETYKSRLLDLKGEEVGIKRKAGEDDATYKNRIATVAETNAETGKEKLAGKGKDEVREAVEDFVAANAKGKGSVSEEAKKQGYASNAAYIAAVDAEARTIRKLEKEKGTEPYSTRELAVQAAAALARKHAKTKNTDREPPPGSSTYDSQKSVIEEAQDRM